LLAGGKEDGLRGQDAFHLLQMLRQNQASGGVALFASPRAVIREGLAPQGQGRIASGRMFGTERGEQGQAALRIRLQKGFLKAGGGIIDAGQSARGQPDGAQEQQP
jgi:hypothetical protein